MQWFLNFIEKVGVQFYTNIHESFLSHYRGIMPPSFSTTNLVSSSLIASLNNISVFMK